MTNDRVNIYRLKEGNPSTWSLPQYLIMKSDGGLLKEIKPYIGGNSIYADDEKNKSREVHNIILEDNGAGHTEYYAPVVDKILNDYLQSHPGFGRQFELFDPEQEAKRHLLKYDSIETALSIVNEKDDLRVKSLAMVVFGMDAYTWDVSTCRASLKKKAIDEPQIIISKKEDVDFECKLLAAHAYFSNIVEDNEHKNQIQWTDTQGVILYLAKGEIGIVQLGKKLAEKNADSRVLLQEISSRINKKGKDVQYVEKNEDKEVFSVLNEKDKEIEELKRQLAEANAKKIEVLDSEIITNKDAYSENIDEDNSENYDFLELEELQTLFQEKTGNHVPVNKKNNKDWIIKYLKTK